MTSKEKKELAKAGLTVSLASLVLTGLKKGRVFRQYHIIGGVALIAFSVWHSSLYKKKKGVQSAQSQEHPDKT